MTQSLSARAWCRVTPDRHRKRRLMRRAFSRARSISARRASAASCSSKGESTRPWATSAAQNRVFSARSRLYSSSSHLIEGRYNE